MKFAVAFIWKEFPRHNRVKVTPEGTDYFWNEKKVACEPRIEGSFHYSTTLAIRVIDATTAKEAKDIIVKGFPYHIICLKVQEV